MGDLARGETRGAFSDLVNAAPESQRVRLWQLLEALVFKSNPILEGIQVLGIFRGDGSPAYSDFGEDGIGLYYDTAGSTGYFVWCYQGAIMSVELQ